MGDCIEDGDHAPHVCDGEDGVEHLALFSVMVACMRAHDGGEVLERCTKL